jgi:hypothetical protein
MAKLIIGGLNKEIAPHLSFASSTIVSYKGINSCWDNFWSLLLSAETIAFLALLFPANPACKRI